MEDRGSAVRGRSPARFSNGLTRPALIRDARPHHRRRRAAALAALAIVVAVAVTAAMVVSAGGGAVVRSAYVPRTRGYFATIKRLAGRGTGSLVVAEQTAQNNAINHILTYTPYVRIAGSQRREIALTFDDGPGPYTPSILSVLEKTGAPATFFEVGVLERYFHASTAEMVARGYPIGDHTELHAPMGHLSPAEQQAQLLQQVDATAQYGAAFPRMFRPPYGSWNATTLRLLHKYKMLMVLWTVDTSDYRLPGVAAIVQRAVSGARPGAIILLHDAGGNRSETVAALPLIVRDLRRRRYRLVTVPRLLLDNPPPRNQAISSVVGSGG